MPGKPETKIAGYFENTARRRIWTAMRILRCFTAPEICTASGAGLSNTRRYISLLLTHGFIRVDGSRTGGLPGVYTRYRLVKNPGPDHPVRCGACGQSLTARNCPALLFGIHGAVAGAATKNRPCQEAANA